MAIVHSENHVVVPKDSAFGRVSGFRQCLCGKKLLSFCKSNMNRSSIKFIALSVLKP